jgi:restriction endonuclease S subunit
MNPEDTLAIQQKINDILSGLEASIESRKAKRDALTKADEAVRILNENIGEVIHVEEDKEWDIV